MVKPYFFFTIRDHLSSESNKAMNAFKPDATGSEVLFFFFFHT